MSACVFPGSFDPITRGHLDLIRRAAGIFDGITVAVMVNVAKKGIIPYEERVRIIRKACAKIPGVRVELWGDEIDSIRTFDPQTQRSLENLETVRIYPASELILEPRRREQALKRIREEGKKAVDALQKEMKTGAELSGF